MDNISIKTEKLLKYGKKQLSEKGVETQATTIRQVLDDISNVVGGGGGNENFAKYYVNQIINEDGTCDLEIEDYTNQTNNVYLIGQTIENNTTSLYLVDI